MTGADWRAALARLAVVAVLAVALAAAAGPGGGRPANEIPVTRLPEAGDELADPTATAWAETPAVTVPLTSAPSAVPDAADTSVETVAVEAALAGDRLYVRLSWADPTADRNVTGPRTFVDAAAVQVPANATTRPAIAMGSPGTLVNVWYWSADAGTEELLAGGAGSTTPFDETAVRGEAVRADGRWRVAVTRDLTAAGDNRTQFTLEEDVDVAFAVWNGSNMERSGRKAVSEWYHFALGPGPRGPPYEALLWTVAGVAIAVVVLVTAAAVRGTRQ